jgi:hypothetical protein
MDVHMGGRVNKTIANIAYKRNDLSGLYKSSLVSQYCYLLLSHIVIGPGSSH